MKVIIENTEFPYDIGIRLLKSKYPTCHFPELETIWDEIEPFRFEEINKHFDDIKIMLIIFRCIGLEEIIREMEPKLISTETISKAIASAQPDSSTNQDHFEEKYDLYRIGWQMLFPDRDPLSIPLQLKKSLHFVKNHDTRTGKENVKWVDIADAYRINIPEKELNLITPPKSKRKLEKIVNPVMAFAWTIMTDIPKNSISHIIRRGDGMLIQPSECCKTRVAPRHLTEIEYRELMQGEPDIKISYL